MSSDGTTARQADNQRRSVDAISETGTLSAARYRGAVPTSQDDDFVLDALRHVKPMEIVMRLFVNLVLRAGPAQANFAVGL